MNARKLLAILAVILGLSILSTQLKATDINVQSWLDIPTLYGGQANITLDGDQRTVLAGQLQATVFDTSHEWVAYCTDLGASLSSGPFTQMTISYAQSLPAWQTPDWAPGGLERATQIYFTFHDQVDSPKEAVALQALIWDALYDTDPSMTEGRFQLAAGGTTPGTIGQINSWLHGHTPLEPLTGQESWWGPTTPGGGYRLGQGLIGDVMQVPEPATYALLIAALPIAFFSFCRSRNR